MPTRRCFLSLSAATVAGVVLPPFSAARPQSVGGTVFTPATLGAYQQNLLSMERMERLVGSLFMVFLDDGKVAYLTLGTVKDLVDLEADLAPGRDVAAGAGGGGSSKRLAKPSALNTIARAKGYVAIFRGETKKVPQGTYVVDHGRLGRVAILLVPGSDEAGETTVVATFASM